jgi:hypothetical protein
MKLTVVIAILVPALAFAQAEPAPEEYVPPAQRLVPGQPGGGPSFKLPPDQPRWNITVAPRLTLALGTLPGGLPHVGLGGGVQVHRALVALGRVLRFGVGFDFAYDRVFHDTSTGTQELAHATFAGVLVLDALVGPGQRVRPFVAVGGGLSVGNYEAPVGINAPSVSLVEPLGLVHLSAGLQVRTWESFELGVHAEGNLTFSSTTAGMPPVQVFSPGFVAIALDFGFRF